MAPSTKLAISDPHELPYRTLRDIAEHCGGWIRGSGGGEGQYIQVWHGDTEYRFSGEALIDFLHVVKDIHVDGMYAIKDLLDYIEKAEKQPASQFVRDAIVARARETRSKVFPDEGKLTDG